MSETVFVRFCAAFLLLIQVECNFNLYVDKEEFHRITGGTLSQVYLVRDGVVNDYALGYVMTVPYHIQYLDFKWQATTKKPVHYEMLIEFSDFFALLQPSANISKVGRLPHKLETFRVALPCSGRLTTEVPVILRFTFHVKHTTKNNGQGHNVTTVNVKRNKICLLKENHHLQPISSNEQSTHSPKEKRIPNLQQSNHTSNTILQSDPVPPPTTPTTPSLLLAGLLGACAVTASSVSVIFFICLKRRLQKLDNQVAMGTSGSGSSGGTGEIPVYQRDTSYSEEDSPACLIRKKAVNWKDTTKELPNSYVNNFWNDILKQGESKGVGGRNEGPFLHQPHDFLHEKGPGNSKGSDVSPYAYAQIIRPNPPSLIEWYQSNIVPTNGSSHIYANHMSSFAGSCTSSPKLSSNRLTTNGGGGGFRKASDGGSGDIYENYGGRSLGSGSLIQIDGFQCPKNFTKEKNVVERFL